MAENIGKVIKIAGPAVDVQFEEAKMPPIYQALRVVSDGELIAEARIAAEETLAADGGLASHPALAAALSRRLNETERAFLGRS